MDGNDFKTEGSVIPCIVKSDGAGQESDLPSWPTPSAPAPKLDGFQGALKFAQTFSKARASAWHVRLDRCADKKEKKRWRVNRRHWRHSIGLDSHFQKIPMFTLKKRTVKSGYAFENTAFEQWFENVKGRREACLHVFVTDTTNRFLASKWFR